MSLFSNCVLILLWVITVESKVCGSIDVRNTPDSILEYRDCRVVEGYVRVVLMEQKDTDFFNRSFAELHEITDFIIIFRVVNLTSLDQIFPNLTYIGGNNLFSSGYALVLHEVPDLEEIGLKSLRSIKNGNVRIQKCPKLCYVDSINWNAIGVKNVTIKGKNNNCAHQFCPNECNGYCWNSFNCQDYTQIKCHPLCIGCTQSGSPKHCISCKFFNNSGTCVKTCQHPKIYDDRSASCITVKKCVSRGSFWAVDNDKCIEKCPSLYERNSTGYCNYTGVKNCTGVMVTSWYDLKLLTNCTHINGSLRISNCDYIDPVILESALGNIVTISDYLLIFRSETITSLDCFKKLETITGKNLWNRRYALAVLENPNLQSLFDNPSVKVENKTAEVLFYENPYLCQSEIDRLTNMNVTNISVYNGYQTACNTQNLNVTFLEINPDNVTLTWSSSNETVIGYIVFYKEIDSSFFNGSELLQIKDGIMAYGDSFLRNAWSSNFVTNNTANLTKLSPYSYYGYFIRTKFYSRKFLETPLYYFKTNATEPSEPETLDILPKNSSSVELRWSRPRFIHGHLTYYKLAIYLENDSLSTIRQRNYCVHPHIECNCKKQEETRILLQNDGCIGSTDPHYCSNKTFYEVDAPEEIIHLNNTNPNVQEFEINSTEDIDEVRILVTNLKHFTTYTFFLRACNEKRENETEHCGSPVMVTQRTLMKENVDLVTDVKVEVNNNIAIVSWSEPQSPNSITVAYHIEYKRTDKNSKSRIKCVTSQRYARESFKHRFSLNEGQYALRILVVSLAGSGVWSEWREFQIEGVRNEWGYGVLGALGVIVLGILGFAIGRKYKMTQREDSDYLVYRNLSSSENISDEDVWKLDEETIRIVRELGQDSVGVVFRNVEM